MYTRHKHTTSAWRNTHTSHTRAPTSKYKQKTQHPSHPLHIHTTYFNSPRLNMIFNNSHYTTNIPTDHTVATTIIKTNMRKIHTPIVSRHLTTRCNNKVIRTSPPHISYFHASLVSPLTNSEQINHPSSNHTYTKSTPNHIHHHCAPSVTPTHTAHIISSATLTYEPGVHPWICGQTLLEWRNCWPDRRKNMAGGPQRKAEWSDSPHLQGLREWIDNSNNVM